MSLPHQSDYRRLVSTAYPLVSVVIPKAKGALTIISQLLAKIRENTDEEIEESQLTMIKIFVACDHSSSRTSGLPFPGYEM